MLADKKAEKAAQRDRAKARKAAAARAVEQEVTIEAMDEDDGEAEAKAEAGRRGRSLATPGAVRSMAMSPELSADAPSLSLDGGGMGLQQAQEPARCLPPSPASSGPSLPQPLPSASPSLPQPAPEPDLC